MTIDVVDELDQPVGTIERDAVLGSGRTFRTAHVFVFDDSQRLLLQKLAANRPRHAGRWGSSVAGYLRTGEGYADAARRRLVAELGVHDASLREVGKLAMAEDGARKFVTLFVARHSGSVTPDTAVIAEVRFAALATIEVELREAPARFTPTFARLFGLFRQGS